MPFSSGVFSRLYNWVTETGTPPIEIAKLDTQEEDFKTAFNNCLLRDGTGIPSAALTWTFPLTINSLNVTSSTIPANGLYLSAANTPALSSNTTLRWSVNSTGAHVFAAPTAGTGVTINGLSGQNALIITGALGTASALNLQNTDGSDGRTVISFINNLTTSKHYTVGIDTGGGTSKAFQIRDVTDSRTPLSIASPGNFSFAAPTSGITLNATALAAGTLLSGTDGTVTGTIAFTGTSWRAGTTSAHGTHLITSGTSRLNINAVGATVIPVPDSAGVALTVTGISGSRPLIVNGAGSTSASACQLYEPLFGIAANALAATYETGSFTGTLTGCTTSPTATFNWTRVANLVTIDCRAGLLATSNATACTITGVPAALKAPSALVLACRLRDNGSDILGFVDPGTTSGTLILNLVGGSSTFTSSGQKGINVGISVTYAVT